MTVITFTGTAVAGVISGALSGLISVLDSQPVRTKPSGSDFVCEKASLPCSLARPEIVIWSTTELLKWSKPT